MRVLQRDYDEFYKDILSYIETGHHLKLRDGACAAPPPTLMESITKKLQIAEDELNKRIEAYDYDISLVERKYGSFIDEHYKFFFIYNKKLHNEKAIDKLIIEAGDEIKKRYKTSGIDPTEIFSRKKKKELSFVKKMKNLFDIE